MRFLRCWLNRRNYGSDLQRKSRAGFLEGVRIMLRICPWFSFRRSSDLKELHKIVFALVPTCFFRWKGLRLSQITLQILKRIHNPTTKGRASLLQKRWHKSQLLCTAEHWTENWFTETVANTYFQFTKTTCYQRRIYTD